jgi:hypothetical protein
VFKVEINNLPIQRTPPLTNPNAPTLEAFRRIKKKAFRPDSQKAVPKIAHWTLQEKKTWNIISFCITQNKKNQKTTKETIQPFNHSDSLGVLVDEFEAFFNTTQTALATADCIHPIYP